jgi:hypothetical protein
VLEAKTQPNQKPVVLRSASTAPIGADRGRHAEKEWQRKLGVTASYFKTKYFVGETVATVTRLCLEMGGAHALFKGNTLELLFRDE